MGFGGVMLIASIYFLYKTISTFVWSLRWKSVGVPVVGIIGDPQRMISSADPHAACNNYDLHVEYNGKALKLQYHVNTAKYIAPGTEYKLLLNPANNDYILASEQKSAPVVCLVGFLACFALFVVSFLIWRIAQ